MTDESPERPPVPDAKRSLKNRARFQIHLSTAIVLMFVAGGLDGRIQDQKTIQVKNYWGGLNDNGTTWTGPFYGWPKTLYHRSPDIDIFDFLQETVVVETKTHTIAFQRWRLDGILINSALGVTILVTVWFVCEWLIRRRAAR